MSDAFWMNLRYALIALGVGIAVRHLGKWGMTEEQATSVVTPLVDVVGGLLAALGGVLWGNWVRKGTKTVPEDVAKRADVPTVSAATGSTEAASVYK